MYRNRTRAYKTLETDVKHVSQDLNMPPGDRCSIVVSFFFSIPFNQTYYDNIDNLAPCHQEVMTHDFSGKAL